jgi:hypothetical protein
MILRQYLFIAVAMSSLFGTTSVDAGNEKTGGVETVEMTCSP